MKYYNVIIVLSAILFYQSHLIGMESKDDLKSYVMKKLSQLPIESCSGEDKKVRDKFWKKIMNEHGTNKMKTPLISMESKNGFRCRYEMKKLYIETYSDETCSNEDKNRWEKFCNKITDEYAAEKMKTPGKRNPKEKKKTQRNVNQSIYIKQLLLTYPKRLLLTY